MPRRISNNERWERYHLDKLKKIERDYLKNQRKKHKTALRRLDKLREKIEHREGLETLQLLYERVEQEKIEAELEEERKQRFEAMQKRLAEIAERQAKEEALAASGEEIDIEFE